MRNYVLLFLVCLGFHAAGTWSLPLIDRDEPRFAEASREMLQRNDFLIPYFNDQYRFDKPPLTYWCQVSSFWIFGENDFAARFPTVVAAALVALVLFEWGKRLDRGKTGWWAATVFTLTLQVFLHGKAAVADMWLVLFFTLAHWSGWEMLRSVPGRKWWWIFYTSLAFGFLTKGPVAWLPLVSVAGSGWLWREGNLNTRFRFHWGIPLTLALVGAWSVPALLRTNGRYFQVGIMHHVVHRSFAALEGHGGSSPAIYLALLPFYFVTVFVSFLPWSIKFPALWADLRFKRDWTDKFLLSGVLVVFLVFTIVKTKLPHYILPAFPLIALLLARRFEKMRLSPAVVKTSAILYLAVTLIGVPLLAQFFPSFTLARESGGSLTPGMQFGAVEYTEPSLVWYFRARIKGFMTILQPNEAIAYMNAPGPRFIILPSRVASEIFVHPDPTWSSYRASGFNIAKGRGVELTMLLKRQ